MKIAKFKTKEFHNYKLHIYPVFTKGVLDYIKKTYPEVGNLIRNFDFKGKQGDVLYFNPVNSSGNYVVLLGSDKKINIDILRKTAKQCIEEAIKLKGNSTVIHLSEKIDLSLLEMENFIDFLYLNSYRFDKYLNKKKEMEIDKISIDYTKFERLDEIILHREKINRVISETRDFINETPSGVNPDTFVEMSKKVAGKYKNIKIEVFRNKELKEMKMNGILSVGRNSPYSPALIYLKYKPDKYVKTISIVGKGITFDSGGLNIKTGIHMKTMKSDMAGAATVLGIMDIAAKLDLKIELKAYIPVAENMPGKDSYKPDDIIVYRNGKSVEIVNTDAEGRIILADALIKASEEKTDAIIEFSTLTGSIVSALGESFSGLMCNNRQLSLKLLKASEMTGERLWEMPLFKDYKDSIKSEIADIKNADYGYASSVKAALFLNEFVGNRRFAHIDIAGSAFLSKKNEYFSYKGATAVGVRLILQYLKNILNN